MEQTVLVVEDEVEINELLREYLTLEGFQSVSAADGKTALNAVVLSPPDAVVLDVMLPDIDGFEICRQLASHRNTALIPVILLTCMNQCGDRIKGLTAGAFRYMNKPFLPDDLIAQIKAAFEWHRQIAARPPCGQIEISSKSPESFLQGLNDMIAAIFSHCELPDSSVAAMRDAFQAFQLRILQWSTRTKRDPHLLIQYRLNAAGELAKTQPADTIEWILSEQDPGLLAEVVLKAPLHAFFSTTPSGQHQSPPSPDPLAAWYDFLAKIGVGTFEKDTKIAQIKLRRSLRPENALPLSTNTLPPSPNNTLPLPSNALSLPPNTLPLATPPDGVRPTNRMELAVKPG